MTKMQRLDQPPASPPQEREDQEFDAFMLASLLWREKRWILATVLLGVLAAGVYAFAIATPHYSSTSELALDSREEQVVNLDSVISGLPSDQAAINTEVEVLQSRNLMGKLVERLDLLSDPEFNPTIREEPAFDPIGYLRGLLATGEGEPLTDRGIKDATIDELLEKVRISNVRQSFVFRITAETTDPRKSARIADSLAQLYIEDQLQVKFDATAQASEWLTERAKDLQQELEAAERAVKEFNTGTTLLGPEALEGLNVQLKQLRERKLDATTRIGDLTERLDRLESAVDSGDVDTMERIARELRLISRAGSAVAEADLAALLMREIANARAARAAETSQIETLDSAIADLEGRIQTQSEDLGRFQQLEREATASREVYEFVLTRLKETMVQRGIHQADSRILSHAVVPRNPSSPRKGLLLAVGGILGFLAGSVIVIGRERFHTGFRSAADLEAATQLNVLGQIPMGPKGRRRKLLDYVVSRHNSALVEAVRNLRTSILLSHIDRPPQIILMTSSVPGEGKTTQSLALTHNFAGMGKRVLLIEGDVRRRTLLEYFPDHNRPGLTSAVSGECPLEEAVLHSDELGVDVLMGDESAINAADFFSSDKFSLFLNRLRDSYDIILIDMPPVLVVPDARVVGRLADAILFVVHWDKTPRGLVLQALRSLQSFNLSVMGLILSQIDQKKSRKYGHGRSDGGYYMADGRGYYGN